ncbi:hypothetical protein F4824DRAFT_505305 [Ustulina deusta]|nr:hypothetical protein F4824DRAFT_505305 [Ustulina deusta]
MTHRRSLDVQLNAALLDFAPRYMKDQLEHLAHECDQRLERELLPQLHAILRQVDQERDAFEEHRQDAARDLRDRLNLLRFDAAAIEHAIGQLQVVAPRYLALFPSASSLALPVTASSAVSASASRSTSSTAASPTGVFDDTPDADIGSHIAASPASTPETSNHGAQDSTARTKPWIPSRDPPNLDHQIQSPVTAECSMVSCSPKRRKAERQAERDSPYKRQKTANENISSGVVPPEIKGRVAFPNLMTGGMVAIPSFPHIGPKASFLMFSEPPMLFEGIFTEPPLNNDRALKHFQEHEKDTSSEEELTNESIFERFALQVDGDEMASKYWITEHLGEEPHTFTPMTSPQDAPQADHTEDIIHRNEETDDDFCPLFLRLRDPARSRQSDREGEDEKPRRSLRNVARPDYAEMVAPWSAEVDIERTSKGVKVTRSTASSKRRLTKPGINSTVGAADLKKPFGYMSEPWPRRSAPR